MRRPSLIVSCLAILLSAACCLRALGDDFESKVDLSPLERLTVQHQQTLKTLDSFARQTLGAIAGSSSLSHQKSLYSVLDMSFRPEEYAGQNIIKIGSLPLRQDFQKLETIDDAERKRILKEKTISLNRLRDPATQRLLESLTTQAIYKANAVNELVMAGSLMARLSETDLPMLAIIPPRATEGAGRETWHNLAEVAGVVPDWADLLRKLGTTVPPTLPEYQPVAGQVSDVTHAMILLREAWRDRDVAKANQLIAAIAADLPAISPERYPPHWKRSLELVYNSLSRMTLPGAALYFTAFVLFLASNRSGFAGLRAWGMRLMVAALVVHTAGIAMRWVLIERNVGSWFDAIPIKNQFESVLMSTWFGAVVGLILELRRGKGLFGAAASFVGWLALIAIFAAPFVTDNNHVTGEIDQAPGVLMSYWLYIHVTMVTAAYALIGMGFLLSAWWLVSYYAAGPSYEVRFSAIDRDAALGEKGTWLGQLDQCNLAILQLAFWVLGTGVVFGAVWADMSWGRPWNWDPKETFALVTWMVYLIGIHIRVAVVEKAKWTAWVGVVGFPVMLFNWIGVNFFLVGLHSYA